MTRRARRRIGPAGDCGGPGANSECEVLGPRRHRLGPVRRRRPRGRIERPSPGEETCRGNWDRLGPGPGHADDRNLQFDLGDNAAATQTIAKLREIALAIKPSGNNRVGPLRDLVWAHTYVGAIDDAFRIVDAAGAGDHHLQGQLYAAIATAATADRGYYLQPRKTLGEGEHKVRRQVLDRTIKAVEPFEFAEEKPYMELATALAKLGDFDAALRFAHRFGQGPIKLRTPST